MLERIQKIVNRRKYHLIHNGEKTNIIARRVKGVKEYIKYVAKSPELKEGYGFFIYNEPNFASFGMSEVIDLVFVDWDGKIIHLEESYDMNKISDMFPKTKYIYILPADTIRKNKILNNNTLTHLYDRQKSDIKMSDFI